MFIDQLLTSSHISTKTKKALQKSIIVEASHVGDYWFQGNNKTWSLKKDFPNIAPPFSTFFLEFQMPDHVEAHTTQWGLLCDVMEKPVAIFDDNGDADLEDIEWTVHFTFFQKFKDSALQSRLGPFWSWLVNITDEGHITTRENGNIGILYMAEGDTKRVIENETDPQQALEISTHLKEEFKSWLFIGLLAISFMHCKNVVLHKHTPPVVKPTPKQKRWGVKPHQPVTYHVLDIEPMKQVLKTEGKSDQVGLQRALHICRGHFSTYTEDHKLFGKYAGTFWIPQHVRGSAEAGIATKDYRIKLDK